MAEKHDRPNIKGPALPPRPVDDSAVARMREEVTRNAVATTTTQQPVGEAVDAPHGVLTNYFEAIVEIVPKKIDTKPMNLRIPTDLHRRLKILAGLQGVTMTEIIIDCLGPEVDKRVARINKGRV
jgi:predicted HicB family RNase H-like nuclease